MNLFTNNPRLALATAVAALATSFAAPAPALAALDFVPGVTDSSTGVLRERELRRQDRFVPGVTDSSSGVLRERERRLAGTDDGLPVADREITSRGTDLSTIAAAAIVAALAAGFVGVAAAGRKRQPAT